MERKITTLEDQVREHLRLEGCLTCRDWKPIEIVRRNSRDEPVPPSECPDCGRDARRVIVLERVERGPR